MFCASPTDAITQASSDADFTLKIFKLIFAVGCTVDIPPTIPTDNGISMLAVRSPLDDFVKILSDRYLPSLEAYAWAAASMARKSWPVAIETASIPFII